MTIKELLAIRRSVPAASKAGSIQTKYKIAKFLKDTESDETFYQTEFRKIIEECAVRNEDDSIATDKDGNIPIKPQTKEIFYQKLLELENTEVQTPDFHLTIEELSPFDLSANDLIELDKIIQS